MPHLLTHSSSQFLLVQSMAIIFWSNDFPHPFPYYNAFDSSHSSLQSKHHQHKDWMKETILQLISPYNKLIISMGSKHWLSQWSELPQVGLNYSTTVEKKQRITTCQVWIISKANLAQRIEDRLLNTLVCKLYSNKFLLSI